MDPVAVFAQLQDLPDKYDDSYTRTVWPLKVKKEQQKGAVPAIDASSSPTAKPAAVDSFFSAVHGSIAPHANTEVSMNIMREFHNNYAHHLASMSLSELINFEATLTAYTEAHQ